MRNAKHGLKALVLGAIVALGAMAFAAGAQGQTHTELLSAHAQHNKAGGVLNPNPLTHGSGSQPGTFLVNLGSALLATIAASLVGTAVLLIAGRSSEIRCTGLTFSGKIDSSTDALAEATFSGCKKFDHKTLTEMTVCLLKELETIKMKFLILPISHGGEPFLLFEPQNAGESLAVISTKSGIGCVLPLNSPVTGSFTALVEALDAVKQQILFSEGIQLLVGDLLVVGGFAAYLKGDVTVELTGTHAGQKLGIH